MSGLDLIDYLKKLKREDKNGHTATKYKADYKLKFCTYLFFKFFLLNQIQTNVGNGTEHGEQPK